MRLISGVVMALVCSILSVASPGAAAEKDRLALSRPVQVSPSAFRLTGRAPKTQRAVILQRRVNGRWVKVDRLRVVDQKYRTRVRAAAHARKHRTVAGRLRSRVRTVPARPASTDSYPPPAGAGPLVIGPLEIGPLVLGPLEIGPSDACGAPLHRPDGTRRTCTFADDFDRSQLDRSKWVPQTNFFSGDKAGSYACYRDHPDNVSVSGGALQLTLRKEPAPLPCAQKSVGPSPFTAGGVMTYRLFSQVHGRFEARIKNTASSTKGLQEAFWLWPDDRQAIPVLWPAAGEIDIVETYSQYPHHAIPFLHYTWNDNGGPVPGLNTAWNCGASRGVWNTYALEWTPRELEIFVNGKSCLFNASGDPAFQRKYIVALTQLLGTAPNSYHDGTTLPATMSVDYVHVWE